MSHEMPAIRYGLTPKIARMNDTLTLDLYDDDDLFPQRGLKNEVPLTAFGVRV